MIIKVNLLVSAVEVNNMGNVQWHGELNFIVVSVVIFQFLLLRSIKLNHLQLSIRIGIGRRIYSRPSVNAIYRRVEVINNFSIIFILETIEITINNLQGKAHQELPINSYKQ